MKKILMAMAVTALLSCNVGVDNENDKDTTIRFDSTLDKVEDKLEQWGDTAKERYKDIKEDVKDRWKKDTTERKPS